MYQKILAIPADLLLIQEEGKRHYVLIKDFSSFKYDHTLYRGRKYFCCCCVQPFRTAEKLKSHVIYIYIYIWYSFGAKVSILYRKLAQVGFESTTSCLLCTRS